MPAFADDRGVLIEGHPGNIAFHDVLAAIDAAVHDITITAQLPHTSGIGHALTFLATVVSYRLSDPDISLQDVVAAAYQGTDAGYVALDDVIERLRTAQANATN
jgi:broad specificity polyphosphatase/5'/3'-nucleotidase SurE